MLQIPELLAPAGDLERLRYAINYGADAVYCSLPEFGMRSAPANFTPEQLTEGVIYAHARGRKVYLTMNTLPTNEEADRLPDAIKEAAKAGVDAFIVADLGVLDACKTVAPDIDVHMSTQTGITNWAAARAAYNLGAKRVVLAREMSLQDIAILRDKTATVFNLKTNEQVILNTWYGGEMKKGMFSIMNYKNPLRGRKNPIVLHSDLSKCLSD